MTKEKMLRVVDDKFTGNSKKIMNKQIERFYNSKEKEISKQKFAIGDKVLLPKGTIIHGTYKNIEGLKQIVWEGLIASDFIEGRISKYPACVGVWNLKKDFYLKDYLEYYGGGTIMFNGENTKTTRIISYNEMKNIMKIVSNEKDYHMWYMEQTKEARFIPSYTQDNVQIAVIFNGDNSYMKDLLKGDILNPKNISDEDVKDFVNPKYYERFLKDRINPDDFFTNRESAILYGIPSNFIEGVLVGRKYENDSVILDEIKKLLPDAYICNIDGVVIR